MLNKQKGNMYGFVTHTYNIIKGKCKNNCDYCYMKRFPQKELWFDEKELKTNLGEDNFIFVGSSTDMFADDVPNEWIRKVFEKCRKYEGNTYLFQTKCPHRYWKFNSEYPRNTIFGVTLETNRKVKISMASSPQSRASNMKDWFMKRKMVTIEPIMDFDLEDFVELIKLVEPEFVNIGADSNKKKDYVIVEPSEEKIKSLIEELRKFTKIKIKDNLSRLGDFSSNEGMELSLNPIPSQINNKNDIGSGTKPLNGGI